MAWGFAIKPTYPLAKSLEYVNVHSDVPSPGIITGFPSRIRFKICQTIADTLGKPLDALHVPSDFLARHGENYDFKGELLGDKASTVVFDNSKIKRLVPDFVCNISMADGLRQAVQFMLAHPETQTPDLEFDSWCDRIADSMRAADEAFLKNSR